MLSLNFEVPGNPDDYYEIRVKDDGSLAYKPIRKRIRALAQTQCDYFDYISSIGENVHIATLESNDAINDFSRTNLKRLKSLFIIPLLKSSTL
jgi:hypothetical protein